MDSDQAQYALYTYGSTVRFWVRGTSYWRRNSSGIVINDGKKHFVVGTFSNADKSLEIYVDGVNVSGGASGGWFGPIGTSSADALIGTVNNANHLTGSIMGLGVHNRKFKQDNATRARQLAWAGHGDKIQPCSQQAHFRLNKERGTPGSRVIEDLSGKENNGGMDNFPPPPENPGFVEVGV